MKFQLTFDFRPSSKSTELLARVSLILATKWKIYLQCRRARFSNVLLIFKTLNTLVCAGLCQLGDRVEFTPPQGDHIFL